MTRLLDNAIRKLAELPEEKQDEMARLILERVENATRTAGARDSLPMGWLKGAKSSEDAFAPMSDEECDLWEGPLTTNGTGPDEQ